MWPRISLTSNQLRLRNVLDARSIARRMASSTLSFEEPTISETEYVLSAMRTPLTIGAVWMSGLLERSGVSRHHTDVHSVTLSTRNEIRTSAPHSSRLSPRKPTDTTSSPLMSRKVLRLSVSAFWTASSELDDDLPMTSMI